jgi:hypothetical protein
LAHLLREEEIKWYQRAKTKNMLEADSNMKYFHLLTNGKHRKTRIYQLQDGNKTITGDKELKKYITSYYRSFFDPPQENNFRLDETRKDDIPQVTDEENESLFQSFTVSEIKTTIFQMEHNKALRPDGFPAEFYQVFWELIKYDLLALFNDFHSGTLPLYSLNLVPLYCYLNVKKLILYNNTYIFVC